MQTQQFMTSDDGEKTAIASDRLQTEFLREYTSPEAILKYTRKTAGHGISYLLQHDYKTIYLWALDKLPAHIEQRGIRILEFGCGGGMNLLHLVSVFRQQGVRVEKAIGTDFSPVLIDAARAEAKNCLSAEELEKLDFAVAKNETLGDDLAAAFKLNESELKGSFDFIFGVNTIRYCHAAGKQLDCAQQILDLMVPGGVCVVIDMNNRFPCFRSDVKNRLRLHKEEECYVPSLEEYAQPFVQAGFEVLRKENFCWVPHSSGRFLCNLMLILSPLLDMIARSRAMRSLVIARKPNIS
jgi:SAM-dependent methyltransferase